MNRKEILNKLEQIGLVATDSPSDGKEVLPVEPRTEFIFQELVTLARPECIIEFGSWEGRSALTWALAAEKEGISTTVICVDTWLGSAEHWLDDNPGTEWAKERLRIIDGEPRVYTTFKRVAKNHGTSSTIVSFRTTTVTACEVLTARNLQADILYVDAAHDDDSVYADLCSAAKCTNPHGLIVCDDFLWASVRRACLKFCIHRSFALFEKSGYAIVLNPVSAAVNGSRLALAGWNKIKMIDCVKEHLLPPYQSRRYGQLWGLRDLLRAIKWETLKIKQQTARLAASNHNDYRG